MTKNRSFIITAIKKSIYKLNKSNTNHKKQESPDYVYSPIIVEDFANTYDNWKDYVKNNIQRWKNNREFHLFFFGGQLQINHSERTADELKTDQSPQDLEEKRAYQINIGKQTKPLNELLKSLEDPTEYKRYNNIPITHGELILDVIFLATSYVLSLLEKDDLFDTLKTKVSDCISPQLGIDIMPLVTCCDSDVNRLIVGLLLLFIGLPLETTISYIDKIHDDPYKILTYNYESPIFNESILSQKGLLGVAGSLAFMYHGMKFTNNKRTRIDVNTLAACTDIFYFESVNNTIDDNLERAYDCAEEAYKRGDHTVSAFNLGYYHYLYELVTYKYKNKIIDKKDKVLRDYNNLMITKKVNDPGIHKAINYFMEASKLGLAAAYTSLGNICVNSKLLSGEEKSRLINYAKELYSNELNSNEVDSKNLGSNGKKKIALIKNENKIDLEDASIILYQVASKKGCLNGTYNCMRFLEKKIIQLESKKLAPQKDSDMYDLFCEYLITLKDYRHPQGTNIYCLYALMDILNDDVISDSSDVVIIKKIIESPNNRDFIPKLYIDEYHKSNRIKIIHKKISSIMCKSTDADESENDSRYPFESLDNIIEIFRYISGYTYTQLCYFWPIYHYCYLTYKMYIENQESIDNKTLTKLRGLLEKIIYDTPTGKDPSLTDEDYQKAYCLLINITLLSNNKSEMCYIFFKYKLAIEGYVIKHSDDVIAEKYIELKKKVFECMNSLIKEERINTIQDDLMITAKKTRKLR